MFPSNFPMLLPVRAHDIMGDFHNPEIRCNKTCMAHEFMGYAIGVTHLLHGRHGLEDVEDLPIRKAS